MTVHILPSKIRNHLRSGIAIPSLGRCVEELVLNSLDAGATCIAVRVNVGSFRLQVIDNGRAPDRNQLLLMGKRYGTSKCHLSIELDNICNYGYRGETLASIVDVSRIVRIESRPKDSDETLCKTFSEGKLLNIEPTSKLRPCSGLTVTVEDFLYNLPVRKGRINETVDFQDVRLRIAKLALIHPTVSFSLQNDANNHVCLKTPKTDSLLVTFANLFGKSHCGDLHSVKRSYSSFTVEGYISSKVFHNKSLQFLYINKHPLVKSKLQKYINKIFTKMGFTKDKSFSVHSSPIESPSKLNPKFGIYILNICCPCEEYEIFVEPSKTFVEFQNWENVSKCIQDTIVEFISSQSPLIKETEDITKEDNSSNQTTPESLIQEDSMEQKAIFNYTEAHNIKNSLHSRHVKRCYNDETEVDSSFQHAKKASVNSDKINNPFLKVYDKKEETEIMTLANDTCKIINANKAIGLEPNVVSHSLHDFKQRNQNKSDKKKEGLFDTNLLQHLKESSHQLFPLHKHCSKKFNKLFPNVSYSKETSKLIHNERHHISEHSSCLQNLRVKSKQTENMSSLKKFCFDNLHKSQNSVNTLLCPKTKKQKLDSSAKLQSYNTITPLPSVKELECIMPIEKEGIKPTCVTQKRLNSEYDCNDHFLLPSISHNVECLNKHWLCPAEISCSNQRKNIAKQDFVEITKFQLGNKKFINTECIKYLDTSTVTHVKGKKSRTENKELSQILEHRKYNDIIVVNTVIKAELYFSFLTYYWRNCLNSFFVERFKLKTLITFLSNSNDVFIRQFFSKKLRNKMLCLLTREQSIIRGKRETNNFLSDCKNILPFEEKKSKYVEQKNREINLNQPDAVFCPTIIFRDMKKTEESLPRVPFNFQPSTPKKTEYINSVISCEHSVEELLYNENSIEDKKSVLYFDPSCKVEDIDQENQSVFQGNNENVPETSIPQIFSSSCQLNKSMNSLEEKVLGEWCCVPDDYSGKKLYIHQITGNTTFHFPSETVNSEFSVLPKGFCLDNELIRANKKSPSKTRIQKMIISSNNTNSNEEMLVRLKESNLEDWGNLKLHNDYEKWRETIFNPVEKETGNVFPISPAFSSIRVYNVIHPFKFATSDLEKLKVINQIDEKFIACLMECNSFGNNKDPNLLVLFDQHAVHERVRLEHFLLSSKRSNKKSTLIRSAVLVEPLEIILDPNAGNLIKSFSSAFASWGFEVSVCPISENIVYVHSIPEYFRRKDRRKQKAQIKKLFQEGLMLIQEGVNLTSAVSKSVVNNLSSQACHGAIKFGDQLSLNDCETLLCQLCCCQLPFQCAHGRPSLVPLVDMNHIRKKEVKKKLNLWKLKKTKTL